MTPEELSIEAKAKRATPGPWEQVSAKYLSFDRGETPQVFVGARGADYEYLSACSPDAVLRMIERLRKMEKALRAHGKHPESCPKGVGIGYYKPPADARCDCGIDAALAEGGAE